jgi:transposase-like protein
MRVSRSALFRGRHFRDEIIVLCLRWHLRYPLSYRNLEEMMAERSVPLVNVELVEMMRVAHIP